MADLRSLATLQSNVRNKTQYTALRPCIILSVLVLFAFASACPYRNVRYYFRYPLCRCVYFGLLFRSPNTPRQMKRQKQYTYSTDGVCIQSTSPTGQHDARDNHINYLLNVLGTFVKMPKAILGHAEPPYGLAMHNRPTRRFPPHSRSHICIVRGHV